MQLNWNEDMTKVEFTNDVANSVKSVAINVNYDPDNDVYTVGASILMREDTE